MFVCVCMCVGVCVYVSVYCECVPICVCMCVFICVCCECVCVRILYIYMYFDSCIYLSTYVCIYQSVHPVQVNAAPNTERDHSAGGVEQILSAIG